MQRNPPSLENKRSADEADDQGNGLPVILGAGLTGLSISRALSAAGIEHVLVGDRPNGEPRLGESLNAEGSLELAAQFPEFAEFFYPKNRMAIFFGDNALSFDYEAEGPPRAVYERLCFPAAIALVHIDRIGFDAVLFDLTVKNPLCRHFPGRAVHLDYHRGTDRITSLELASGICVRSSYVFDATNQARIVGKSIGLPCELIGPRQRVVFAHHRASSLAHESNPWQDTTSLVRLTRPDDALEGLGWCIPLGEYVSVGINVEAETCTQRDVALLLRLEEAFAERSVDVRRYFPERGLPTRVDYQHYTHERAYGRNWLLAGPSYCQTWFPSGAGVGTALVAAQWAKDALVDPIGAGANYEAYMQQILAMHAQLDWLSVEAPEEVSEAVLKQRGTAMVRRNAQRLAWYVAHREEKGGPRVRDVCSQVYEHDRRETTAVSCR